MKKLLLLLTSVLGVFVLHAQNAEADSLKKLLPTAKSEPARVLLLSDISYAYLSSYPDSALVYAQKGLTLAEQIKDDRGKAYCLNALGNVYFHAGDYSRSLEMYLQSLEMKERLKKDKNLAVTYFNIADVYTEQSDYTHALYYLFKTKAEDEKAKDNYGLLFDLYSLGSVYLRMQKADSALYYMNQSYDLSKRSGDKEMRGAILNTYGEIYFYLNQFEAAANYYRESIPFAKEVDDEQVVSANYFGLAKVAKEQKKMDSAVFYARHSLQLSNQLHYLKQVLDVTIFLKDAFKEKKKFDSAFHYQELSIATKDSLFNVEEVKKVQNLKFTEFQRQQAIEKEKMQYRAKIKLTLVIFASCIFLAIMLMLWRNNKQKQKAYLLLQQQKAKTDEALNELKATQTRLVLKEKMASLGELTAGIAHEIQNPLNFVNNFSEVSKELLEDMQSEWSTGNEGEAMLIAEDVKQNLEKIIHHGHRAGEIVKAMLQHSRKSSGEKVLTNINALTEEFLRLSYRSITAKDNTFHATVIRDFDESLPEIKTISQDVGSVLLNIFNNAFYAMAEKKQEMPYLIGADSDNDYEPALHITTEKCFDESAVIKAVRIKIKDNGTGIKKDILDKIFQPFFTTKPTGKGTGLGLSLSYDMIKAQGGDILVNSEEGEGTEFIIELPVKE